MSPPATTALQWQRDPLAFAILIPVSTNMDQVLVDVEHSTHQVGSGELIEKTI